MENVRVRPKTIHISSCGHEYYGRLDQFNSSFKEKCIECKRLDTIPKEYDPKLNPNTPYLNSHMKYTFKSECGHEYYGLIKSFRNNYLKLCKECIKQNNIPQEYDPKLNPDTPYIDVNSKCNYISECGHIYFGEYSSFIRLFKEKCVKCRKAERIPKWYNPTLNIDIPYTKSDAKYYFQSDCGHLYYGIYGHFKKLFKEKCSDCKKIPKWYNVELNINNPYTTSGAKYYFLSECNHIVYMSYSDFNDKRSKFYKECHKCKVYELSNVEKIVSEFITLEHPEVEMEVNKSHRLGVELDFYFPAFNFAIEINGLAFHATPNCFKESTPKSRHFNKFKVCKDNGIFLLQLTDMDIFNKWELIKSMIQNRLGLLGTSGLMARKLEVKEVKDRNIANEFLEMNHLQGRCDARYRLGLFNDTELVSYISFSKDGEGWDLSRFCNKVGTLVPGGFTRLLKNAQKKWGLVNITTFSDNMYSDGGLYSSNGFTKVKELPIDYKYTNNFKTLEYKSAYMKSRIKSNPNLIWEDNKTELELMEMNSYSRYYDAGKIKWKLID